MRYTCISGLLLLVALTVGAQRTKTHLGITVSTTLSFLNAKDELFESNGKTGISAGLGLYHDLSSRWQFVSGLNWEVVSVSGRDYSPMFGCDIDSNVIVDPFHSYYEYSDKVHYLIVPVEFRYLLSKKSADAFFVQAGITNHFKLGVSSQSLIIECEIPRESGDSFNPFYGMHVRGTLGFGYRAKIGKMMAFVQPTAQYSFNSIIKQFAHPHLLNLALRLGLEF